MKVLIVDDEDIICEWLQFCISQNPVCQLAGVAHNGREALEVFRASGLALLAVCAAGTLLTFAAAALTVKAVLALQRRAKR